MLFPYASLCFSSLLGFAPLQSPSQPSVVSPTLAEIPDAVTLTLQKLEPIKITLHQAGVSLPVLLKKWSTPDVAIFASAIFGEQRVTLHTEKRSLRSLLEAIAELYGGSWRVQDSGKTLFLEPQVGQKLYAQNWWSYYLAERKKAQESQYKALMEIFNQPPIVHKLGVNVKGDKSFVDGLNRNSRFFSLLSGELKQQLAKMAFTENFSDIIYDAEAGETIFVKGDALSDEAKALIKEVDSTISTDEALLLGFSLSGNRVHVKRIVPGQPSRKLSLQSDWAFTTEIFTSSLDQKMAAQGFSSLTKETSENWKRLLRYQNKTVWKNKKPQKTDRSLLLSSSTPEILKAMSEQKQEEFLSDYYTEKNLFPVREAQRLKWKATATEGLLDQLAEDRDYSWTRRPDKLFLIRNNRWYRDDALQVSKELRKAWIKQLDQEKVERKNKEESQEEKAVHVLEWGNRLLSNLSPYQIAHGLQFSVDEKEGGGYDDTKADYEMTPFAEYAEATLKNYRVLRFYSSLTEEQKTAFKTGVLPLYDLTPAQWAKAESLLIKTPTTKEEAAKSVLLLVPLRENIFVGSGFIKNRLWLMKLALTTKVISKTTN